jgi:hypothetical protein
LEKIVNGNQKIGIIGQVCTMWLSKKSVLEKIVNGNQKIVIIGQVCTMFCSGIYWIGYPYHALKVSMMQYQANPSTNFFQSY